MRKENRIIKMDLIFIDSVLKNAGYIEHESFYKGEWKKGYIKEGYMQKRFHAFIVGDSIELHVDKTIKNRHIVMNKEYTCWINKEISNLRKIYRTLNPYQKPASKKELRKLKDTYAPNIMELQRTFKTSIKNKMSIITKIKNILGLSK